MPNKTDIEPIYKKIGARVGYLRHTVGMTQEEFAKILHLKRAVVSDIENGDQRIYIHHLIKLTEHFKLSKDHFLKGIWP